MIHILTCKKISAGAYSKIGLGALGSGDDREFCPPPQDDEKA